MKDDKIGVSGEELISLSCGLAMAIYSTYGENDLRKIRHFLASISANLNILESEDCE